MNALLKAEPKGIHRGKKSHCIEDILCDDKRDSVNSPCFVYVRHFLFKEVMFLVGWTRRSVFLRGIIGRKDIRPCKAQANRPLRYGLGA